MNEAPERRHTQPLEVQVAVIATKIDQLVIGQVALVSSVEKIDGKVGALDTKVDTLDGKMQRIETVVAIVRFLGVSGVVIAAVALMKAFAPEVFK